MVGKRNLRLELYLRENPARNVPVKDAAPLPPQVQELSETVQSFHNPAEQTRQELAGLWKELFEFYAETRDSDKRPLRLALIPWLWKSVPRLAANENALRVAFDRKLAKWKAEGAGALLDGREQKRGIATAHAIPQNDLDLIIWTAATRKRGRIAPAVRELKEHGQLTHETKSLLPDTTSSKSYVNRRLAAAVKPEVELVMPFFL